MAGSLEHWNKIKNLQIFPVVYHEGAGYLEHWNKIENIQIK